jgi:hypothetical protein
VSEIILDGGFPGKSSPPRHNVDRSINVLCFSWTYHTDDYSQNDKGPVSEIDKDTGEIYCFWNASLVQGELLDFVYP